MSRKATRGEIRVGPAGWSYDDWAGIVYPPRKPRGFHEASYLAQFFETIEINTTFYHPPEARMTESWVRRVSESSNFKFTAKLWQRFTHDRNANREDEKLFKEGIRPLVEAGRLGALLLQFPWSFKNTRQNREYLSGLLMMFMEFPLVIEVRHSSWNRPDVFEWLAGSGVGFCNIDQPVIGRSLAPTARATAPVGYVRLHGRNYEQWFSSTETGAERYNYFYSMEELEPWAERIRRIADSAEVTFVITNNHFRGQAIANALQLVSLLRGGPVRVPETMLAHYPQLQEIASSEPLPSPPGETGSLFDPAPVKER
jgi:uncharacterized protein YecE (DUF72 family)